MGGITGSGPLNMIAEASNPEEAKYNDFEGASLIQGAFFNCSSRFQYQNEKICLAKEELFYIENFLKK